MMHRILRHALARHLPSGATVHTFSHLLDSCLTCHNWDPDSQIRSHRAILNSAEKLGTILRNLKGLALDIVSTQPVGAIARHTSVFIPLEHPLAQKDGHAELDGMIPRCVEPVDVLVEMTSSGEAFIKKESCACPFR